MFLNLRLVLFLLVPLLCAPQISAQEYPSLTSPGEGKIHLDLVVTAKSGPPLSGLVEQDFTILDNKKPQALKSFQAVDGRQVPIEVILVIDAVNTEYKNVAMESEGITKFLKIDGGNLAYPTRIAILTEAGIQFQEDLSKDGNAISDILNQHSITVRSLNRAAVGGDAEHFQTSLQGLWELMAQEVARPGRKIIVWISPGWPVLSEALLDAKQQQQYFQNIVDISTHLRESRITLYSVDPLGTSKVGLHNSDWKPYLKPVSKVGQMQPGNLAVEVIATHSGGLALGSSNDVAAELQSCVADAGSFYEISFDPPVTDRANEYHHLEIRVAKPGLTARTWQGYYSQP
ncbi:MAG TPA: VWA domain-containing protein [Verrucomicrobiae bacterium]|jgi:VWFA-related protein|nr:VWA domain-containing protein [Verrucomicrobiae bacterium]